MDRDEAEGMAHEWLQALSRLDWPWATAPFDEHQDRQAVAVSLARTLQASVGEVDEACVLDGPDGAAPTLLLLASRTLLRVTVPRLERGARPTAHVAITARTIDPGRLQVTRESARHHHGGGEADVSFFSEWRVLLDGETLVEMSTRHRVAEPPAGPERFARRLAAMAGWELLA